MTILILGGTAQAKEIAVALDLCKIPIVYSVAGLVRQPTLNCTVISGGFSQFGGLSRYVKDNAITAILDATHPYAAVISAKAIAAAQDCSIPVWQYARLAWRPSPRDNWFEVASLVDLPERLRGKKSIFLTIGQVSDELLGNIVALGSVKNVLIRTAAKPTFRSSSTDSKELDLSVIDLKATLHHIQSIGPFNYENELALLTRYKVDALVSKNSGGVIATKLLAARELSRSVFMLAKPASISADKEFSSIDECIDFIRPLF